MKARLSNLRISPRKVRLVADLIKGKKASEALVQLSFLSKRSTQPLAKLINSAVANSSSSKPLTPDQLIIKDLTVDKGVVLKRFIPRAQGRATPINKRTSRVEIKLIAAPVVKPEKVNKADKAIKK